MVIYMRMQKMYINHNFNIPTEKLFFSRVKVKDFFCYNNGQVRCPDVH